LPEESAAADWKRTSLVIGRVFANRDVPVRNDPAAAFVECSKNNRRPLEMIGEVAFLKDAGPDTVEAKQGRYLPHLAMTGRIYHVRFSLIDAMPCEARERILKEKEEILTLVNRPGTGLTVIEKRKLLKAYAETVEATFDAGHGSCRLKQETIGGLVAGALRFFEGKKYVMYAWCIMPNHVHAVVQPIEGFSLSSILHSWKSYTANKANKLLGRSGTFWQRECLDRLMRSEEDLNATVSYVYSNPDKAGLVDWGWRWFRQ
jgi:REP element-mobilizing transposase RayT